MSNMANQLIADVFKSLAHPTRLRIIKLLKEGPLCVCKIIEQTGAEQSNISQHLSVLKNQGIVESRKDGLMVIYKIKTEEIYKMIEIAESLIINQLEETKYFLTGSK